MKNFLSFLIGLGIVLTASGQVAITSSTLSYHQDFDSLSDTTLNNSYSSLPAQWEAMEFGSNADQEYRAAYGELAGGDLYSFGDTNSTERALGSIGSGSNSQILFGASFVNLTTDTLSAMVIQYMGEQWRQGRPGTARSTGPDTLFFAYATNPGSINDPGFIGYPSLDFSSAENNAALNVPLDGNLASNRTWKHDTINGLQIAPNDTVYIRWRDFNSSSYDDGLAVDSLTVTFIPQAALPRADFLYIGQSGKRHYEDFNTLGNQYTPGYEDFNTLPSGWHAHENGVNANSTYRISYGEFADGEIYSYGANGSTDRALGSVGTGSIPHIYYGAAWINNTGDSIRSMEVRYTGEQWRQGRPGVDRATGPDTLHFGYAINAKDVQATTFTELTNLSFSSAENNGVLNTPLDGNLPANQSKVRNTINNLKIGPNDTIWIRWRDFNSSSFDDGLAIDSLLVTFYDTTANVSTPTVKSPYRSISQFNYSYSETFDSLAYEYNPGAYDFSTLPHGWFASETGSNSDNTYKISYGEFAGGNMYSYGDSLSTERALGSVGSGANSKLHFGSAWINNTTDTITTVEVKYIGEQWRQGRPGNARATGPDTLHFDYAVNATGIDGQNFTKASALSFYSPIVNGVLNTPLDGNDPINQTRKQFVLVNLQVAPGDTMWLRWTDYDSDSYDDGLAIDSVEVTALQNFASTEISFTHAKQEIAEIDGVVNIPIDLINESTFSSQVEVFVADSGTASFYSDYNFVSTNTIYQPGDTLQYFSFSLNRNEPFESDEYFVLGLRNFGNAIEGSIKYDTIVIKNYTFPTVAISSLKGSNTQGVADSINGRYVVEGVVHGVNYSTSGGHDFYILDQNHGLNIYAQSGEITYTVTEGDKLKVWGQLAQFRGLTRLEAIDSIQVIANGETLSTPAVSSTLSESTESDLITLEKIQLYPAISNFPSNMSVTAITSTNDTVSIYVSAKTDLAGKPAPSIPFTITGIGSQFSDYNAPFEGGYRLMAISNSYSSISLSENNASNIAIYPNPFNNVLNIESPSPIARVEVISLTGKVLTSTESSGLTVSIELSKLAAGTYLVRVQNEEGVIIQKIVK